MTGAYLVWCPDYGQDQDEGRIIGGSYDHADAAKNWAEQSDINSAEYSIASGQAVTVLVMANGEKEAKEFVVCGEARPHYTARLQGISHD